MGFPEGLRFREEGIRKSESRRDLVVLIALFLVVSALLAWRSWAPPEAERVSLPQVRVKGAVSNPGWVSPAQLDIHSVLMAAGESTDGVSNGPVSSGWTVERSETGHIRLSPSADLLVFGLPLPLNEVDAEALQALPGIGPVRSARILADRAENGPFPSLDALTRVSGIGPKTLESLRPFLAVESAREPEKR
ncbi:MAG: helix-hairpin-helix domain-containing protein [Myxococcota bacterium]|nr:helix-hairpin-helix domain-containing protein [Myxococcota bacterium]